MRYFQPHEFHCLGQPVFDKMQPEFLALLDECRHRANIAFKITSSYRDPEHNRRVGGAPNSMHLQGRAVDIACNNPAARWIIIKAAIELGLSVGIMEQALHLDNRDSKPVVFDYYKKYRMDGE